MNFNFLQTKLGWIISPSLKGQNPLKLLYSIMILNTIHLRRMFLLWASFCKILTSKIWFRPIGRIFHEKKWPKFIRFQKKILLIARTLLLVPIDSQKYRNFLIFSYFHISTCGQIWLNHFQKMIVTLATSQSWKKKPCHGPFQR